MLLNLMQEKITQTSSANSEHEHSKIEHFLMLNKQIFTFNSILLNHTVVKTQKTPSLSVVNKFISDLHLSVTVISRQY